MAPDAKGLEVVQSAGATTFSHLYYVVGVPQGKSASLGEGKTSFLGEEWVAFSSTLQCRYRIKPTLGADPLVALEQFLPHEGNIRSQAPLIHTSL